MFKWKVSGLGGGQKKNKHQNDKLNNVTSNGTNPSNSDEKTNNKINNKEQGKNESNLKDKEIEENGNSSKFKLFQNSSSSKANSANNNQAAQPQVQPNGILRNSYDQDTMNRVGQRLAMNTAPQAQVNGDVYPTEPLQQSQPQQPMKTFPNPGWRSPNHQPPMPFQQQHIQQPYQHSNHQKMQQRPNPQEQAIPSDSLYGHANERNGGNWPQPLNPNHQKPNFQAQVNQQQPMESRPSLSTNMEHWSSHGYLAKTPSTQILPKQNIMPGTMGQPDPSGYVVLKRQGDQMAITKGNNGQPNSLPNGRPFALTEESNLEQDRKYYSVKGFSDIKSSVPQDGVDISKYYSVDARYNSVKNFPPDLKLKLRQVHEANQLRQQQQQQNQAPFIPPHGTNGYQQPPIPPPRNVNNEPGSIRHPQQILRQQQQQQVQQKVAPKTSLEKSKQINGSVSWLEWTQQLQAYVAWVNSQLRKRPDLKQVNDLRKDLQSGEVLAQLIEIISGEEITGIQYKPESLQGMKENLERILRFMVTKKIRMHQISSKEILEGNLKAVMRLILALAAHYKPQSVRHHDVSYENLDHNTTQTVADNEAIGCQSSPLHHNDTTQLNETQDSLMSQTSANSTVVKGKPIVNSNCQQTEAQVYENMGSSQSTSSSSTLTTVVMTGSMSTQTDAKSPLQSKSTFQREDSFVRTGSGRKLPKIPDSKKIQSKAEVIQESSIQSIGPGQSSTLPTNIKNPFISVDQSNKTENRKSKPKALEFWESLATVDDDKMEFKYNTIHRMSSAVGRRMLPKPPPGGSNPAQRSQSLDRNGDTAAAIATASPIEAIPIDKEQSSLNSSFSGPTSLPTSSFHSPKENRRFRIDEEDLPNSGADSPNQNSKMEFPTSEFNHTAPMSHPSPPSSDSRGEVEGSSDNNSPPTSVIQGVQGDSRQRGNPALDWLRGSFNNQSNNKWKGTSASKEFMSHHEELSSEKFHPKFSTSGSGPNKGFHSLEEEVMFLRSLRMGDGNSSSSKQSDSMSDSGLHVPYEVLLQDLTQAKRQLLELHNLILTNNPMTNNATNQVPTRPIILLESPHLSNEQECHSVDGSGKLGLPTNPIEMSLGQMKQNLVKTTLAKQTLEVEKKELLRKIEDLESSLTTLQNNNSMKDRHFKISDSADKTSIDANELRALYDEELAVAKDAISNLRTSFSESDPNQHILDTLEQCISVVIEKFQNLEQNQEKTVNSNSRLSSMDYSSLNDGSHSESMAKVMTKILYFTNRSATPFMSSVNKRIGEITLRDFKTLFDRPGFFRFHFKSVDQEFGMVKEEITSDEAVLPGSDGKIVAWVDED